MNGKNLETAKTRLGGEKKIFQANLRFECDVNFCKD